MNLPIEMLHEIARCDEKSYRAMLSVPVFARSLTPSIITDYMILFGYTVRITKSRVVWSHNDHETIHHISGLIEHRYKGERHNDREPAIIRPDGTQIWYRKGVVHRDNGPAIIHFNGDKAWYSNGLCHRKDEPAKIFSNGDLEWYKEGLLHRINGPARIRNKVEEWWINGHKENYS